MKQVKKDKFLFGLLLTTWFLTFSINSYLGYRTTKHLALVQKKRETIDSYSSQFAYYLSMMKDAETGERGYAITGEEVYLEPYNQAVAYLNQPSTQLFFLEAERHFSPLVKEKLLRIQELQKLKLDELQQVIDARKDQGFEEAKKIILRRIGKNWMDEIRVLIAEVLDELSPIRLKIDQEIQDSFKQQIVYGFISSILYLLFSVFFVLKIYKEASSANRLASSLLLANEERDFILNSAQIGTWYFDVRTKGLILDDVLYGIFGLPLGSMRDYAAFLRIVHPSDRERVDRQVQEAVNQTTLLSDTFRIIWPDGKVRFVTIRGRIFLGSHAASNKMLGALWDVTDRYMMDIQKDEFISMVSHEMRTPLTIIHGALELLQAQNLNSEEAKELLVKAQRNSVRLTQLVHDIIDIEKFQLGKIDLSLEQIQLCDLIVEAIHSTSTLAEKKEIQILTDRELPQIVVEGDYARLLQVMMNLLSNAIKFSPSHTRVVVSIELLKTSVRVSVKDEGPGISEEFQKKIFEKFVQVDSSSKRPSEGAGLGLVLCKNIIDQHKGTIGVVSKVGEGATFFFELPLRQE